MQNAPRTTKMLNSGGLSLLDFNFQGSNSVHLGPSTEEENLPENAGYNSSEEKLFPHNTILPDAGHLCERGKMMLVISVILVNWEEVIIDDS